MRRKSRTVALPLRMRNLELRANKKKTKIVLSLSLRWHKNKRNRNKVSALGQQCNHLKSLRKKVRIIRELARDLTRISISETWLNSKDKANKVSKIPLNKIFQSLTPKSTCWIWSQIPKMSWSQRHQNPNNDHNPTKNSTRLKQATKARNRKQLLPQVAKAVLISLSKELKRMVKSPPRKRK